MLFHGGVPGRQRGALVKRFRTDPSCRVFLSTDAGGVGLNLQCASVVVNLDLPWNPAVLEQRIGRAHRLGQHRVVRVLNFVAEASIEHNLMRLLAFKQSLAAGVLDGGDKEIHLGGSALTRFMETVERATVQPVKDVPPTSRANLAGSNREATMRPAESTAEGAASNQPGAEPANRGDNPWQPLLTLGQSLLAAVARGAESNLHGQSDALVRRDPATGERYLHLPVPDRDTIARLADVLRDVLAGR